MIFKENKKAKWLSFFSVLSLIGMYIHNSDLPLSPFSAENSIPTIITISLLFLWLSKPGKALSVNFFFGVDNFKSYWWDFKRFSFRFLVAWSTTTFEHLLKHTIYAIAQFPLIIALFRLRRIRNSSLKRGAVLLSV